MKKPRRKEPCKFWLEYTLVLCGKRRKPALLTAGRHPLPELGLNKR